MIELTFFAAIGLLAGFFAGLLGIGGGAVAIPLLVYAFHQTQIPPDEIMHIAIGTSLASMIFATFSSMMTHRKRKAIKKYVVIFFVPGAALGAMIGPLIAKHVPNYTLQLIFGGFETLLGIYCLFGLKSERGAMKKLSGRVYFLIGLSIGTLAAFLGLGGGLFAVPILSLTALPIKIAIGCSSVMSFTVTFIGALTYVILGLESGIRDVTFGYVYLPAFFAMSVVTFFAAPIGAKLAHRLPTLLLKRIFGIALIIAGLLLIKS